jgi:hypothetical protein
MMSREMAARTGTGMETRRIRGGAAIASMVSWQRRGSSTAARAQAPSQARDRQHDQVVNLHCTVIGSGAVQSSTPASNWPSEHDQVRLTRFRASASVPDEATVDEPLGVGKRGVPPVHVLQPLLQEPRVPQDEGQQVGVEATADGACGVHEAALLPVGSHRPRLEATPRSASSSGGAIPAPRPTRVQSDPHA